MSKKDIGLILHDIEIEYSITWVIYILSIIYKIEISIMLYYQEEILYKIRNEKNINISHFLLEKNYMYDNSYKIIVLYIGKYNTINKIKEKYKGEKYLYIDCPKMYK